MQVQGQGADSASMYGQGACVFGSEVGEASLVWVTRATHWLFLLSNAQ
jgi:hypothetical protein